MQNQKQLTQQLSVKEKELREKLGNPPAPRFSKKRARLPLSPISEDGSLNVTQFKKWPPSADKQVHVIHDAAVRRDAQAKRNARLFGHPVPTKKRSVKNPALAKFTSRLAKLESPSAKS